MAIDILSRIGSSPIIVGDEKDMQNVMGLLRNDSGETALHFRIANQIEEIRLSPATQDNMLTTLDYTAVALTAEDKIAWAFRCSIDRIVNLSKGEDTEGLSALDETELKELAEDLVAGDFNLDFLRGGETSGEQGPASEEASIPADVSDSTDPLPTGPMPD